MKLKDQIANLPFKSQISFHKVYDLLERVANADNENEAKYAQALMEKFGAFPGLKEGTEDLSVLHKHRDFVNEIMSLLFPSILTLNEIKGATAPFQFDFFYTSERLKNILDAADEGFEIELENMNQDDFFKMSCTTILQAYYHYPVDLKMPIIFEIPDKDNNPKYYRSAFNADLLEVSPTEKAIEIDQEIYWELLDNFHDIALWKKYFPKDSWIVKGVGLVSFLDVTTDQLMNQITSYLLSAEPDAMEKVLINMRRLLDIEDLRISFISLDYTKISSVGRRELEQSILLDQIGEVEATSALCKFSSELLLKEKKPFILSDTEAYIKNSKHLLSKQLAEKKIKSYMLTPLVHQEEFLGFIELGSPESRTINTLMHEKMKILMPILAMAASRYKEEYRILTEAIIQEQCTSIHSSVKWKFEDMARNVISAREIGENIEFNDILFEDVYPLYGQVDIKSSSIKRNDAVLQDLKTQLTEVESILNTALRFENLPAFEELLFRIKQFLKEFEIGLFEGSEQRVLQFLKSEIYPIFDYLGAHNPQLNKVIQSYQDRINDKSGIIYNERKKFDESVTWLNQKMAAYIDQKQLEAQKLFPHYFERYKTDGLEFNMYIGDSISQQKKFSPLYLDNLHLWQLKTICELEGIVKTGNKEMSVALEVASLILLINTHLSIKFRVDEKRFDVDGAYNARYEIIKKRIDKAHIKDTNERITQPGKIVIIYSDKSDARNYKKHIDFMINKGYLTENSLEDFELEELQGISGLRAMRVDLNYEGIIQNNKSMKSLETSKV